MPRSARCPDSYALGLHACDKSAPGTAAESAKPDLADGRRAGQNMLQGDSLLLWRDLEQLACVGDDIGRAFWSDSHITDPAFLVH